MTCTDPELPVDERNLVVKAALMLQRAHHIRSGAALHLEKHIPYGAGLGSGPTDAAAALLLLNTLWDLHLTPVQLNESARELGSDVPFFLGAETAWGGGRGEELDPLIDPNTNEPYRPSYPLVIAVPHVRVSTVEAYAMIVPREELRPDLRKVVLSDDLEKWESELRNDFEQVIMSQHPAIREIKSSLKEAGARYAAMSGSGSAVYGFFNDDGAATAAAEALRLTGHQVWMGRA
jgi:4-diphosphocytidyl-2-C-methyl-D-erythritol kinase